MVAKKNLLIGVLVVGIAILLATTSVEYYYPFNGAARNSATSTTTQFDTLTSTVTQIETLTSTVTQSTSSTSSFQPNATALDLSVSIEPIASPQGLNLTVVASVRNPTSSNLTLSSRLITNPARGACAEGQITSVNVYLGHLGQGNLSDSKPLLLFNPYGIYSCPTYTESIFTYVLGPGQAMNETSLLYGHWSGSGTNPSSYSFQPFQVGDYTIVVSDAWGQRAFEYFAIVG